MKSIFFYWFFGGLSFEWHKYHNILFSTIKQKSGFEDQILQQSWNQSIPVLFIFILFLPFISSFNYVRVNYHAQKIPGELLNQTQVPWIEMFMFQTFSLWASWPRLIQYLFDI